MRLLPDDSNAIFEEGHLFFLRDGTLMAVPFDPAQRKAIGEAFPVAENVAIAANNRYGAFSLARNGTLAYWGGGGAAKADWFEPVGECVHWNPELNGSCGLYCVRRPLHLS